jgi:hypothetical protein
MKIESLKPGMTVWSVQRRKMGNTTISTVMVYPVRIIDVDVDNRVVIASCNHNLAEKFYGSEFSWRKNEPYLVRCGLGNHRLARRDEIAKLKAAKPDRARGNKS